MIDREHGLSIGRQAKALGIGRGPIHDLPRPTSDVDLALMRRIDELPMEHSFAGSRMLRGLLRAEGREVGRLHVSTLMKKLGIEAIYRRPNTSKPAPGHKVHPYLLRTLAVTRPNQAWAMDLTSIPMARGFVYPAAALDWVSRKVLAWRLSITPSADRLASRPCRTRSPATPGRRSSAWSVVAPPVRAAMRRQGSQFTSIDLIAGPKSAEVAIGRDGRGAQAATMSSSSASGGR